MSALCVIGGEQSAGLYRTVAALRDKSFKPKFTGLAKQVRPDLAMLERRHEFALAP
jgi:hypothetical protein